MPRILENEQVGSFKIIEKIGEGGMAVIYKATQPSLKRDVVVKKLKDPNREIIERFKKEAFVSASFSQENVLAIYDFIYHGRSYYLIMEYVDGKDLRTLIDVCAPLPPYLTALIIRDVAKGLEYTHDKGIIHRDIKPSNILISYKGEIKLIDFGVAKDETPSKLTMTGMIVGTPSYMSPEQANGDTLGSQSDIYSLGVLMYEMLTGLKPFSGDTNTEILMKIVKGKYTSPRKYNRDIPWRLAHIINKALRRDVKGRYRNAAELIRDLNKFIPWQEQTQKKEVIGHFLRKQEVSQWITTSTKTRLAGVYQTANSRFWPAAIILSLLFVFAALQLNRFLKNERLSRIEINANDSNASVYLDDQKLGLMPRVNQTFFNILPGTHLLELHGNDGNGVYRRQIYLVPGEKTTVTVRIPKRNAICTVFIDSVPRGARVFIDGRLVGKTPVSGARIQNGQREIRLVRSGYETITEKIHLDHNQAYTIFYPLKNQPQPALSLDK